MEGVTDNPDNEMKVHPFQESLSQHSTILKELGDCYAATGDADRARHCYQEAAELSDDEPAPYVGLGTLEFQNGDADAARQAFIDALGKDSRCAEAYAGLAMIDQQEKDYISAFDLYLKCLEIDGDNLVALLGLFQTSCQMGSFTKVIHYLELYLDKHPGDTSVLFCLASLYAQGGQLTEAREVLLNLLALDPGKTEAEQLLNQVQDALDGKQDQPWRIAS
ncbi:MAG: tetratricopeptide repeat protein [Planctomycetota bacterium]|jgi:tetratricopeptide (TPR) repeat protein